MNTAPLTPAQQLLASAIRVNGPLRTIRVSSAKARGAAKKFPYWGAVRYEVRLRKRDGAPVHVAVERASSDRRSQRLAEADAQSIASSEGRIWLHPIGEVSDANAQTLVKRIIATR